MRVLVSGDLERPLPQDQNVSWLFYLIKSQIEYFGSSVELDRCDPIDFDSWLEHQRRDYNHSLLSRELDLTICFEGPMSWRHQTRTRFIDVWCHPCRFMDDLVFGVRSNFLDLSQFSISKEEMVFSANLVRASMIREPSEPVDPGTTLVIGQTARDRSVIVDGAVKGLSDFADQIPDASVLFKPHPHEDSGLFRNKTRTNIYKLLSLPQIDHVIGLSSSVLFEAQFFDKRITQFLPSWWEDLVPIRSDVFLSFEFWKYVFGSKKEVPQIKVPVWHSTIRKTARAWWGYDCIFNR